MKKVKSTKSKKAKSQTIKSKAKIPKFAILAVAVVAVVGGFFIYRSFAASSSSGLCATPRGYKKIVCFGAGDAIEATTPEVKIVGNVRSDRNIRGSGPTTLALFSNASGHNIWSAPIPGSVRSDDYSGLKDKNLKLCFKMQGDRGTARAIVVLKSGRNTQAQKEFSVSPSEYRDYCIDKKISSDTLKDAKFELYSTGGAVKVWYMTFSKEDGKSSDNSGRKSLN